MNQNRPHLNPAHELAHQTTRADVLEQNLAAMTTRHDHAVDCLFKAQADLVDVRTAYQVALETITRLLG